MNSLFDNAVQSIVLGVDDYQTDDPKRALSAVRNLYAGVLLLGKEVLIRRAPKADPDTLLAWRVEPKPDGDGGVTFSQVGHRTVDFEMLGKRLKAFGVDVDLGHMRQLSETRNNIEHRSTALSPEQLREQIAAVFPIVVQLFHHAQEEPSEILKDAWQKILQVHEAYEVEAKACQDTLEAINWARSAMSEIPLCCPVCGSRLVAQRDPANSDPYQMACTCRACFNDLRTIHVVEATLGSYFPSAEYVAMTGRDEESFGMCLGCDGKTYLWGGEDDGCTVCGDVLGKCVRCGEQLTPLTVTLSEYVYDCCSYCHYKMHKDD